MGGGGGRRGCRVFIWRELPRGKPIMGEGEGKKTPDLIARGVVLWEWDIVMEMSLA